MKNLSLAKSLLHCLLITFLFAAAGCSKSTVTPHRKNTLIYASWVESPKADATTDRVISFDQDNTFRWSVNKYDTIGYQYFSGTYTLKGDSLLLKVQTQTVQEGTAAPVTTPSDLKLFDKATFVLDDQSLKIKYTSYPADGPVPAEMNFKMLQVAL
jgi:hypothetical protein